VSVVSLGALRPSNASHCAALLGAADALLASPATRALSSWYAEFAAAQGTTECDALASAARDGAIERLMLTAPALADDVVLGSAGADTVLASRFHALIDLQLGDAPAARDTVAQLQANLAALPVPFALAADEVSLIEQSAAAPRALAAWAAAAAVGACAACLLVFDAVAAALLLATLSAAGLLLTGALALLPPPHGAAQLVWLALGTPVFASQPALAVAALVRAGGWGSGVDVELGALRLIAPPLVRSAAVTALLLLPLAALAPMRFLRSLSCLLLAALALGAASALVLLPLLHAALRRPPPPPPTDGEHREARAHAGASASTGLLRAARPVPSYATWASRAGKQQARPKVPGRAAARRASTAV